MIDLYIYMLWGQKVTEVLILALLSPENRRNWKTWMNSAHEREREREREVSGGGGMPMWVGKGREQHPPFATDHIRLVLASPINHPSDIEISTSTWISFSVIHLIPPISWTFFFSSTKNDTTFALFGLVSHLSLKITFYEFLGSVPSNSTAF